MAGERLSSDIRPFRFFLLFFEQFITFPEYLRNFETKFHQNEQHIEFFNDFIIFTVQDGYTDRRLLLIFNILRIS